MEFWASHALPIILFVPPVLAAAIILWGAYSKKTSAPTFTGHIIAWGFLTAILFGVIFLIVAVLVIITGLVSK
jgi:hypothetical protein